MIESVQTSAGEAIFEPDGLFESYVDDAVQMLGADRDMLLLWLRFAAYVAESQAYMRVIQYLTEQPGLSVSSLLVGQQMTNWCTQVKRETRELLMTASAIDLEQRLRREEDPPA